MVSVRSWSIGCNLCSNTGYRGRVGVYELLQVTDNIREHIVGRSTHHELRKAACWYAKGLVGANALRIAVFAMRDGAEVVAHARAFFRERAGRSASLAA